MIRPAPRIEMAAGVFPLSLECGTGRADRNVGTGCVRPSCRDWLRRSV